jgi:hypothetical protein
MCYFAHQMLKMYLSRLSFARLLGTAINGTTVLIPLIMTFIFYFFLTIGAILSWGMPYFFDSSQKHKLQFSKFKNTDHFLPARGDNVIPNTLHVVLHLQVWTYLVISIYFLTLVKC